MQVRKMFQNPFTIEAQFVFGCEAGGRFFFKCFEMKRLHHAAKLQRHWQMAPPKMLSLLLFQITFSTFLI